MTATTVREIMTLPALQGTSVLAGAAGLDRPVTGVNVMEVPDIEGYVRHGELLLTTAYPIRDRPERLVELVPALAARGLAALAVKPLRYLDHFPDRLAAIADRLGFPVLVLPDDISFNDVIGSVLAVVLAEYGAEPARAEAIRERLTGVALAGGGLEEIARTLAGALDREVVVVDRDEEVLGRGDGPDPAGSDTPWSFPITVAGAHRGHVLIGGREEPTLGQRRLIRQACFAAGMTIAQAMAGIELDRRLRVLFLEELVTRPDLERQTVRQRSRLFGWDLSGEQAVVLARGPVELADATVAARAAEVLSPRAIAWSRGHEVVAIVPHEAVIDRDAKEGAIARWRATLGAPGDGTVVAVGPVAREAEDLAVSHAAARETLRIAEVTGRATAWPEDVALERLLLAVPRDTLTAFVEAVVGPLVAHDEAHGTDLCRTLATYLAVGNGAEAARRLYIHYNTFKHRMARVAELVDADPTTERLTLALALEARSLL